MTSKPLSRWDYVIVKLEKHFWAVPSYNKYNNKVGIFKDYCSCGCHLPKILFKEDIEQAICFNATDVVEKISPEEFVKLSQGT